MQKSLRCWKDPSRSGKRPSQELHAHVLCFAAYYKTRNTGTRNDGTRNTRGTTEYRRKTEHHRNTEQRNAEHQWNSRNTTEYRNNGTPQKLEPKDKHGIFIIFNFHSNAKLSERWTGKRILIKSFGRRKLYGNEDTPPFLTFFSTVALLPSRCSWKDSWK